MGSFKSISISISCLASLFFHYTSAATFEIINNCPFTVWAAAIPGGGMRLDNGQAWAIFPGAGTKQGRIWARTGCNFDSSGNGKCQTGDCNGLLQCQTYGAPPNTLAEYALNQHNSLDYFDVSLVDGFNVPMEFSPISNGCTRGIRCTANINGQCPSELKAPGGCNNPCTVFKTKEYCCTTGSCGPTNYSKFFKDRCPDAYSYPMDDQNNTFTCPGGTNYRVTFCPFTGAAATFKIRNNCPYTVWAAAVPGGGMQLNNGQTWTINPGAGTNGARIWARTGCNFDGSGRGSCQTGDCNGLLHCQAHGVPPNTLAEYALNNYNNLDFFDISLVDGFNVPMEFSPISDGCTSRIRCKANINSQCPSELKAPGGCNSPCTVFNTKEYCCTTGSCGPTNYSKFFKDRCPDAYSYPMDDQNNTVTCPWGTKYQVIFCP